MSSVPRLLAATFTSGILLVAGCGGSGGSPPSGTPTGSTPPATVAANPCVAALAALGPAPRASSRKAVGPLGHDDRDPRDLLALTRLPRGGHPRVRARAAEVDRAGDIAVLIDDGALIVQGHPLDLFGAGLRFTPNTAGGYDVAGTTKAFRPELGQRLVLGDDDSSEQPLDFAFYGAVWSSAFVNSDGSLTFGAGDTATTERSLGRVLSGAPRVAPFFADLDPSAGGAVFADAAPDAFTVTWCEVPGFDSEDTATVQASLFPGGEVEVRIDASTTLADAVVALSPGSTGTFQAVDLSAPGPTPGGAGAVGERFATEASLDLAAASRLFYEGFPDVYDQLVYWTDVHVTGVDAFAFESTVRNHIAGIGQPRDDFGTDFGSPGSLASVVLMDNTGKYPSDPAVKIRPRSWEDTSLSLLAHETGHRWGATLRFQDPAGGPPSDLLLGRQRAHWSFFCDSDASVLEGNDIEDLGGGRFETTGAVLRYGPLDLYSMGLIGEAEVPPVFFVADGSVPGSPGVDRETAPATGVSITGTRRDVTIADIVAAMGPRLPPSTSAPRLHRQAWVYVVTEASAADPAIIEKLERFRQAFEGFFFSATGGRMTLDTRLD
jgi:hypothetical protein